MELRAFTKENLLEFELRLARERAARAIRQGWPSAQNLVEKYNRACDNWNNTHPAYLKSYETL